MPQSALVIDDEPQVRRAVAHALSASFDSVLEASSAEEGLALAAAAQPALVVLDLGLPDADGIQVCREIRSWSSVPIIVLSARHSEGDMVRLLDAGADDYIRKPFGTAELQARARAQLRRMQRQQPWDQEPVHAGGLVVDLAARTVSRAEREIHLTPTEWALLRLLLENAGKTLTHPQILNAVWRDAAGAAREYLRVHIATLRRKIEQDPARPALVLTEPGVGYRFAPLDGHVPPRQETPCAT